MNNNELIDHEVRIRLLEQIADTIDKRFDMLNSKMDTQFHWVLGTTLLMIVTIITLFGGAIVTKLI